MSESRAASRTSIHISEVTNQAIAYTGEPVVTRRWWAATLNGPLSTGEWALLERTGATATEALANLEAAISEQGWEISDTPHENM